MFPLTQPPARLHFRAHPISTSPQIWRDPTRDLSLRIEIGRSLSRHVIRLDPRARKPPCQAAPVPERTRRPSAFVLRRAPAKCRAPPQPSRSPRASSFFPLLYSLSSLFSMFGVGRLPWPEAHAATAMEQPHASSAIDDLPRARIRPPSPQRRCHRFQSSCRRRPSSELPSRPRPLPPWFIQERTSRALARSVLLAGSTGLPRPSIGPASDSRLGAGLPQPPPPRLTAPPRPTAFSSPVSERSLSAATSRSWASAQR